MLAPGCRKETTLVPVPGPHLLITEVSDRPPEFIEVYNPGVGPVPLDGFRLSDRSDYWRLTPAGGGSAGAVSTFLAAFPPGTRLGPRAYAVVASDGVSFRALAGRPADLVLGRATGAEGVMTGSILPPFHPLGEIHLLTNAGDIVVLFWWDGVSDLVQDVDMVAYGDGGAKWPIDKTGALRYRPDAALGGILPGLAGNTLQRIDLSEGDESLRDGNGIASHDETSEPVERSFAVRGPATPWGP
ncbi:MAG: lamin tail domain-containing protein [Planctomycetes bacterium]|nr:lamin tail domain-containing protein [Planctomycetota bacterium]